jgi:adenylosuccinate synthase
MNIAVLGAQWGDEGKGKVVDLLAPHFAVVARHQGGHNAGHTVFVETKKIILRLLPSGVLHSHVTCVIGNGVVVDPQALFGEIDELAGFGYEVGSRLVISERAHVILPYHRELELLSEARRGERKIGTTSRGIGPAYEDKIGRRGIRVRDLFDRAGLEQEIRENVQARNRLIKESTLDWRPLFDQMLAYGERMKPAVADVSSYLAKANAAGRPILFEGAQGALLDIDHGTYPFVTSSNTTIGGVCTGLGVSPKMIHGVLGVVKAYATRVGEGPMPTELLGARGDRLRASGKEFGSVTGRPRRCGWYDAVVARYATRLNGLDSVALTKLDVLDTLDEIKVCTAYRHGKDILTEWPADLHVLAKCEPVYETLPGWSRPSSGLTRYEDLPREAQRYVAFLEEVSGVPVSIVSTGSGRRDTIVRERSAAAEWFGVGAIQY